MTDPSITGWTRLEPQTRDPNIQEGVKARLFDPVWLLTRQWQMGEFQAEDRGAPVLATLRATTARLSRKRLGDLPPNTQATADPYDPLAVPLEAMIERRPMRPRSQDEARMLPLAVEGGQQFLRMLGAQSTSADYRGTFISHFGLPALAGPASDEATARFMAMMVGRAPDGRRLAAAFRGGISAVVADSALGIAPGDHAETIAAATAWLEWWDGFCTEPDGSSADPWLPERMEYAVTLTARTSTDPMDEVNLTAFELRDGQVDWMSFDLNLEVNLGSLPDRQFASMAHKAIPAPVTFRGCPAPRYWEMEEARLAYGLVPVGPTDLTQLMAIEYASSYGNDWFVVPLTLPIGSVTAVDALVINDSFGVRTLLRPIGDPGLAAPGWSMWSLDFIRYPGEEPAPSPRHNLFFLPPTAGRLLDGVALEEVMFARDEMANLAWAIERSIESPLEQAAARPGDIPGDATPPAPGGPPLRFRLASAVPKNWTPLLPVQSAGPGGTVIQRLRRGAVLQPDGSQILHEAEGEILGAREALSIFDEEVPREGLKLTRNRRLARWLDGSTWLWTAVRRQVGRGEGSSGLSFDRLEDVPGSD
jgi:hypothetical protein